MAAETTDCAGYHDDSDAVEISTAIARSGHDSAPRRACDSWLDETFKPSTAQ
jgi:hypothetical protein